MIVYILAGFFSGVISGMGIGGGVVLIPALVFIKDVPQQTAQSVNLLYFIPTAAAALITHQKNKNIERKVAAKLIFFGLIGAALGALIGKNMDSEILKKMFGVFLFVMGVLEFFKKKAPEE
jgi:uncharacterized membrane protein YfcA